MSENLLKRLWIEIDLHIVVVGIMISCLMIGFVSVATFVPGNSRLLRTMLYSGALLCVPLMPMVLARIWDKREHPGEALPYFTINMIVVFGFSLTTGAIIHRMLPRVRIEPTPFRTAERFPINSRGWSEGRARPPVTFQDNLYPGGVAPSLTANGPASTSIAATSPSPPTLRQMS